MPDRAPIAALVEDGLRALRIPGCSLAIVARDGREWSAGFGWADLARARPAAPETVYHLFSVTKLVTAAAVLQLAEAGKLKLDDPLAAHLPEFRALAGITIKHLLSHCSGLRDTLAAFLAVHFPDTPPPSTAEALRRYRIAAKRPPGQKVEYRNVNYALLGEVVSRAAGQPFASYVSERILKPLGMTAGFAAAAVPQALAATGYMGAVEPARLFLRLRFPATARRLYGARIGGLVALQPYDVDTAAIGGLRGSVSGFLPFVRAQLQGGGGILSADSTALMQTLAARGRAGAAARLGVGLGWKLGQASGRAFLNHEGGGPGFTAEARLYPREGLGIVIAMNRLVGTRSLMLAHRISEAVCDARNGLLGSG